MRKWRKILLLMSLLTFLVAMSVERNTNEDEQPLSLRVIQDQP